ncbi:hypothetical protein [Siphonobacter sp. SORGH_AS_0500]|uniref:hypothetical protein n=1 Tax=Siphonobacter sp. SORGH_AS_0500 TaxID=1864824 RepID=UPI002859FC3D|nr:hypothetical protein [Siphonobacter sp. SORGH_AS_0500]MDR6197164.1 hypothetical protein [Siphonobacter sp. SORGH_AS_0500]
MKRYIPNLIPDQHRVMPHYFKESKSLENPEKKTSNAWWFVFLILFLLAIAVLPVYAGLSFWLLLMSFLVAPSVTDFLEQKLRFQYTPKLKLQVFAGLSLIAVLPGYQFTVKRQEIIVQRTFEEKQAQQKAFLAIQAEEKAAALDKARKNSLQLRLAKIEPALKKKQYSKAIQQLVEIQNQLRDTDTQESKMVRQQLALAYVSTHQFAKALPLYTRLIENESDNSDYLYQRAICFQKSNQTLEAVTDAYHASQYGSKAGEKLYNQLNPEKKRLLYYQTVCCDGSYSPSNAKGRGACSHHGGVCDWNYPIYETYRKYDVSRL